jgi:hypothetical protein
VAERWETVEQVIAARDRFESAILGWEPPAVLGVGRLRAGRPEFVTVSSSANRLSAVALATVIGHRNGSASYPLTASDLARVVELLAPAEACTTLDHPNLVAWRSLAAEVGPLVAVFLADPDLHLASADPYLTALQARFRKSL